MLVLEEQHRLIATDRRSQEAVCVERRRRVRDHQTRRVREECRTRLRVIDCSALQVTTDRNAHHHRAFRIPVRTPTRHGYLIPDLVKCGEDVIEKLDLDNGFEPAYRHAHSTADDVRLGERRIKNTCTAKLSLKVRGHLEHTALTFYLFEIFLA